MDCKQGRLDGLEVLQYEVSVFRVASERCIDLRSWRRWQSGSAFDDPAEVRKLEIHISKAVETARLPGFRRAYEETFENYFREGGDPSHIQVNADQADPYVFIFNTRRFMGKCGDRTTPIRWEFPCFATPRVPDCIRKVAPGYGGASYGLVQPSTRIDGKLSPDEILITLESADTREFTALVDERRHAGITACWEIIDKIEQTT
ncbi:uncharacterized protein B0I36DRAFT_354199 [Microdochium trichocladiopsis]|uniref:Uncharacterized protein n=1 Tax=Microdochium trichocladiopsis TaxID=1682393 RepID=A0A9P8XWN9_9PEZI|nr:uncharacterized protein B0I36DRAFT_354199 [Microdochium trichocladiopsis]KAH7021560.1 hypothetical protein B0I36DRAFT_354199 [Microdochium trichocladiopsis]